MWFVKKVVIAFKAVEVDWSHVTHVFANLMVGWRKNYRSPSMN